MKMICFLSALLIGLGTYAQPPGLRESKKTQNKKDTNILILQDTLRISYDTTKVRYIMYGEYESNKTYLFFTDGFMIRKIYSNGRDQPVALPSFFSITWEPIKKEEIYDVKNFNW